jgi:hypothetical protein
MYVAIAKVKGHKSPGSDQIPAELIQAVGEIKRSEIHKLINHIWNKEELSDQWKESIIVPVYKKGDKIDCSNYLGYHCYHLHNKMLSSILLFRLSPHMDGNYCGLSMWVST